MSAEDRRQNRHRTGWERAGDTYCTHGDPGSGCGKPAVVDKLDGEPCLGCGRGSP